MQILTPKQMRRVEEQSDKLGVTLRELMLNAGKALAELTDTCCRRETALPPEEASIVFLTGSGNNGGDCFVAAEKLVYKGYNVTVIMLCGEPNTPLAQEMFDALPDTHINIVKAYRSKNEAAAIEAAELDFMTLSQVSDISELKNKKELSPLESILVREKKRIENVKAALVDAHVIVDGVFGTGFRDELDNDIAAILNIGSGAYRIAVDIPSGGNGHLGTASLGTFKADETITFGYMKAGMTQYPLKNYCGRVTVADIGIPREALSVLDGDRTYQRIDRRQLAGFPPAREKDAHKGKFGRVLVIAGSSSMRGAASLSTLGALRSGAGLVQLASVEKCIDSAAVLAPEATFVELDCDDYGFMLYDSSRDALLKAMEKASAVVIGCGIGVTPDTVELTKFVTENAKVPVIIDADGINCIASDIDILLKKKTDIVITPHMGEMARLLNCDAKMIADNRFTVAEKYAEKYGITVVLKGAGTIIADSRSTAVNHTGNAGMSRGGSGDILAGIIGSVIAQGCSIFDGCCAGVYIHGLAGDSAAERLGQEAMLPRDIIDSLSDSFRILKEKSRT